MSCNILRSLSFHINLSSDNTCCICQTLLKSNCSRSLMMGSHVCAELSILGGESNELMYVILRPGPMYRPVATRYVAKYNTPGFFAFETLYFLMSFRTHSKSDWISKLLHPYLHVRLLFLYLRKRNKDIHPHTMMTIMTMMIAKQKHKTKINEPIIFQNANKSSPSLISIFLQREKPFHFPNKTPNSRNKIFFPAKIATKICVRHDIVWGIIIKKNTNYLAFLSRMSYPQKSSVLPSCEFVTGYDTKVSVSQGLLCSDPLCWIINEYSLQ